MIFEIAIHSLPQEIDELQNTLVALKRSSYYLDNTHHYKVNVCFNTNMVDWSKSIFPKEYFIDRIRVLEELTNTWAETHFQIEDKEEILGNFSYHRQLYETSTSDFIINIDTDLIFSETLLANMINAAAILNSHIETFILIPEISKLWDSSWDSLVHKSYRELPSSQDYITADPYQDTKYKEDIYVDQLNMFKFGMGWFTLISKKVLDIIKLPKSMGHYGPDDTFIMLCCEISKEQGIQIGQYVIRNEVVRENIQYRSRVYNSYLSITDRKDEFRNIAQNNFEPEIRKFISILNQKL